MLHRDPESLDALGGDEGGSPAPYCCGDDQGKRDPGLLEKLLDGDEGGFRVERVKDRFDEEKITSPFDKGTGLVQIAVVNLVKGNGSKGRVVVIRSIAQGDGKGADRAGDISADSGLFGKTIRLLTGQTAAFQVQVLHEGAKEFILEDFLEEVRVLAASLLPGVLDEKLSL